MSRERAQRRAEREAVAAEAATRRQAEAARAARSRARRQRLTGWLPRSQRPGGVLAEKRRKQVLATAALLFVLNLLVYAVARDPGITGLLLVASVLGFPIVHMMLFRRTS